MKKLKSRRVCRKCHKPTRGKKVCDGCERREVNYTKQANTPWIAAIASR